MPPPLVSIVTPSYNQGRFLRRTIESVLRQTYPHIEYIVNDGGSSDESVSILQSFGCRLHWVSEPDNGQTHAINKGFAASRGEIRSYLNSDDVLLPNAVEKIVEHFQRHPDWQLIYGRSRYIDELDRIVGNYRTAPFSLQRLARDSCICQPAAFWRAELSQKVGAFDENLHYCMDYDYWIRCAKRGARMQFVNDSLAFARIHPQTKSQCGMLDMYKESISVCRKHLGSVELGPFLGLWRRRLQNSDNCWTKLAGNFPGMVGVLATSHQMWINKTLIFTTL